MTRLLQIYEDDAEQLAATLRMIRDDLLDKPEFRALRHSVAWKENVDRVGFCSGIIGRVRDEYRPWTEVEEIPVGEPDHLEPAAFKWSRRRSEIRRAARDFAEGVGEE